ncbi:MAG: glycosyltransferase family 4 protein, partial [Armatimonadota bacterium]|nr:glycosyltransferase family 4 protein [Armatimonadota bacterium]
EYINSVEWNLQNEAWRVIVCTEFMKRECEFALQTPWDKMDVVPNGVDAQKFVLPEFSLEEKAAFRAKYAAPEEKIIFFVGRMVREKGVQVLIESLPKVRWGYHDAKLLICGGGQKDHLINLAAYLGMERHVYFAGFVPDDDLMKIYSIIDIACFPSLYEPFGIVALEAMAAKVPVVVSDAGGLPEVVENNVTGITTYAGNPNSLADGLLKLLHEPETANRLVEAAYERVQTTFNWDNIATQTRTTYDRVWNEAEAAGWIPGDTPPKKESPQARTNTQPAL